MNKLLADTLGILNAAIAVVLILTCIAAGVYLSDAVANPSLPPDLTAALGNASVPRGVNAIMGAAVGILLAVIVCGLLALLVDMRKTLRSMLRMMEDAAGYTATSPRR